MLGTRAMDDQLPLYILAGGRSSRFGTDKARALVNGKALIRQVADVLASRASSTTVVADQKDKYLDLGLPTIADRHPGCGPLGGIHTAVEHRRATAEGWLLVASCDLYAPRVEWVDLLRAAATNGDQAVLFQGERVEPLFGVYHTSLAAPLADALARAETAVWRFVQGIPARLLPLPDGLTSLPQINTRDDLLRAADRAAPRG